MGSSEPRPRQDPLHFHHSNWYLSLRCGGCRYATQFLGTARNMHLGAPCTRSMDGRHHRPRRSVATELPEGTAREHRWKDGQRAVSDAGARGMDRWRINGLQPAEFPCHLSGACDCRPVRQLHLSRRAIARSWTTRTIRARRIRAQHDQCKSHAHRRHGGRCTAHQLARLSGRSRLPTIHDLDVCVRHGQLDDWRAASHRLGRRPWR